MLYAKFPKQLETTKGKQSFGTKEVTYTRQPNVNREFGVPPKKILIAFPIKTHHHKKLTTKFNFILSILLYIIFIKNMFY